MKEGGLGIGRRFSRLVNTMLGEAGRSYRRTCGRKTSRSSMAGSFRRSRDMLSINAISPRDLVFSIIPNMLAYQVRCLL